MLYILRMTDFLHRLKINHDSHEFILECGTIANIQFCTDLFLKSGGNLQLVERFIVKIRETCQPIGRRDETSKKHCAW
jgi:hypothetical protein